MGIQKKDFYFHQIRNQGLTEQATILPLRFFLKNDINDSGR